MSQGRGQGQWELAGLSGVLAAHAALLPTGKLLFFTRPEDPSHRLAGLDNGFIEDDGPPDIALGALMDLDGPNAFCPRPTTILYNPFCAGHVFLPDGRLLVAGGDKKGSNHYGAPDGTLNGLVALRAFDSIREEWVKLGRLSAGRWYPYCCTLPDGSVFILSGSLDDQQPYNNINPTCECWPPREADPQYLPFLVEAWPQYSFPPTFVLPSGRLYVFAGNRANYLRFGHDSAGVERWLIEDGPAIEGEPGKLYPNNSTSVLLPLRPSVEGYRAETLVIGGGGRDIYQHWDYPDDAASQSCFRLGLDEPDAAWQRASDLNVPRVMPDAVLLPDGTVLVVNGARAGYAGGNAAAGVTHAHNAVLEPELYDPIANKWTVMAPATCARLYHSTALLLPDATVLVAGSDQQVNGRDGLSAEERARGYEYRLERYSPPYLSQGPRPEITNAPAEISYGASFSVELARAPNDDARLQIVLVAPGSVTHGANMSQRLVELVRLALDENRIEIVAPCDGWIAPPGPYMIFVLCDGVPSIARFVQLGPPMKSLGRHAPTSRLSAPDLLPPTNATAWYSAETGVLRDIEGAITGWLDRSGNGHDLQATLLAIPEDRVPPLRLREKQINGRPVIHFPVAVGRANDSTVFGRFLVGRSRDFLLGATPYAIALVARPWPPGHRTGPDRNSECADLMGWGAFEVGEGNAYVALRMGVGPGQREFPVHRGTASIWSYWQDRWKILDQNAVPRDQLVRLDGAMLVEAEFDGRDITIRVNRREIKRDTDRRNTQPGALHIGHIGRRGGAYYRGDIAEILIYDRTLGPDERAELHDYVNARYALW